MKYLTLLFIGLNVFSNDEIAIKERSKALKTSMQAKVDLIKSKFNDPEISEYVQKMHENQVKNMIVELYNELLTKELKKADEEAKCLVEMRSKLDSFSLPYNGSESCAQLKVACEASEDCSGRSQGL